MGIRLHVMTSGISLALSSWRETPRPEERTGLARLRWQGETKNKTKEAQRYLLSTNENTRKRYTQQPLHPQLLSADKSGKGLELDEGGKRHIGSRISHRG
jgi:hypothetical protein